MARHNPSADAFKKWQDGFADAPTDPKWQKWDCEIQLAVGEYNRHLAATPGYLPLDWLTIKGMIWVESGAAHSEWNRRVMQIGVEGDPGLASLLSGSEGGELIMPPNLKSRLTVGSVRTIPADNIRAGIGFLLMRHARFEFRNTPSADRQTYTVPVKPGDSLDKIARNNGTTVETLKRLNPGAAVLRPGQTLSYEKASIQKTIAGWKPMNSISIADLYNGGGDATYARKLDFVAGLIRNTGAVACAQ